MNRIGASGTNRVTFERRENDGGKGRRSHHQPSRLASIGSKQKDHVIDDCGILENELFVPEDPPKRIQALEFSIPSALQIQRNSVMQVTSRELYEMPNRLPAKEGVLDSRLGAIDKHGKCETCHEKLADCIGHFGYIQLELPVFHIGFFKMILQTLQMICKSCSHLLLKRERIDQFLKQAKNPAVSSTSHIRGATRKKIWTLCRKNHNCDFCGSKNGSVKKVNALRIIHTLPAKKKKDMDSGKEYAGLHEAELETVFNANPDMEKHANKITEDLHPLRVLNLFTSIPRDHVPLLDMDPTVGGPENLILQALPVPPLCVRPSVCSDPSVGSTEDDLTMKLTEIVQINNLIRMALSKGAQMSVVMEDWEFLQLEVARYINSELPGLPPAGSIGGGWGSAGKSLSMAGSKPLRGISQRLKGKTGRFRGNLSGKRVDFSGRTVISPDPNLRVDQVGIPRKVAMMLTYPQRVTKSNIEWLRKLVRNGPDVWPGANFVEYPDGRKVFLKYGNRTNIAKHDLDVGFIVERHLHDGDWVLFNRQPSLHRVSIMAHRAKVQDQRTFRFNECVCTPYNADYDGDEMNLHVPQTEEARSEAAELMSVLQNLVTPKSGEPLIAATQDFLTCAHLLTNKDVFMDSAQFGQACAYINDAGLLPRSLKYPEPCIIKPMKLWSGKQLISFLTQYAADGSDKLRFLRVAVAERTYNKYVPHKRADPNWDGVDVIALAEQMDPNDGFVYMRRGELLSGRVGKGTIGSGSKKGILYQLWKNIGPDAAARAMNSIAKFSSRWHSEQGFSIGVDDVKPSAPLRAHKAELLKTGYEKCNSIIEQMRSGKLALRPGCNQEQTMEAMLNGELSKIREDTGKYCIRELDPSSNSALMMALCGSKGSTINIAQMVACVGQQTVSGSRPPDGFLGRSLPHFETGLQARKPEAKGFVENSFFSGMTCTEFFFHTMAGREGLVDTAVKTAETGYMQRRLMKALEDLGMQYDNTIRASDGTIVQFTYGDDGLDPCMMENSSVDNTTGVGVFDPEILFDEVMIGTSGGAILMEAREAFLQPSKLREQFDAWINRSQEAYGLKSGDKGTNYERVFQVVKDFFEMKIKKLEEKLAQISNLKTVDPTEYTAKEEAILFTHSVRWKSLQCYFEIVKSKLHRAKQEAGSTTGAIAAQSIGEPGTQMTLKTFHFAGVASMNITLGVPRLKEIINASKSIATPIITATLENNHDVKAARIVKGRIESCNIGHVSKWIKEVYRPHSSYAIIKLDLELISKLQLDVTAEMVEKAIRETTKLKLKEPYDVKILAPHLIRVNPPPIDEAKGKTLGQNMQLLRSLLPKVNVVGIGSVGRAVINDKGGKDYNLLVEGEDMLSVMGVTGVRGTHVTCNHIMAVEKALGIEAARKTVMSEIQYTMQSHGMSIDPRHVMLLADVMSYRGEILGITRFGIVKMKTSTLMLASFEMTVDHLFDAAVHNRRDDIIGVSECIIMGVPIPLGTGLFKVLRDTHRQAMPRTRRAFLEPTGLNLNWKF